MSRYVVIGLGNFGSTIAQRLYELGHEVIAIGEDLGASILALLAVRDLGIKGIYVKVTSEDHGRIADALGATDTVFPERQAATNLASRITSTKLLHYTAYGDQFGIQEMAVPEAWSGKTLAQLELPATYKIQVVAIHDNLRDTITVPQPTHKLTPSDTLLVAGAPAQLEQVTKLR